MRSRYLKFLTLCLCFLTACFASAQQKRKEDESLSKPERRQKLYPELVRTFDLAGAAPAPLRALAFLRIASFAANKGECPAGIGAPVVHTGQFRDRSYAIFLQGSWGRSQIFRGDG